MPVLIDWTGEFDRWYEQLIERALAGDGRSLEQLALVDAELGVLQDLQAVPEASTPTLRRVSQSRRYQVWLSAYDLMCRVGYDLTCRSPAGQITGGWRTRSSAASRFG